MKAGPGFNLILCSLIGVFCSGCIAVLGGAAAAGGAYFYSAGELKATRNVTLPDAYEAAVNTLDELGIAVVEKSRDGLGGLVIGRGSEEKRVRITLRKVFDDVTEVRIRIGFIGDEHQSRIVFDRMEQRFAARQHRHWPVQPSI